MPVVSKFIPHLSLKAFLFCLVLLSILFVGYFHTITAITQDLGRHILTGKIILASGSVPTTNLFSYTHPDYPFVNHHWFSEVLFYLATSSVGISGLLILMTIVALCTYLLLFLQALQRSSILSITTVSLLLFPILFERTDLRPELFSFFFLSIYLVVLYSYRERFTKWIFLLPFIQLLWSNTHIYFFVGCGVIGLFFLDFLFLKRKHVVSREVRILALVFFISLFVMILNPHGIKGALYPLQILNNYGYTIEENQNVFFLQSFYPRLSISYFYLSVIAVGTTLFLNLKRTRLIDWLLVICFTILGAMAVRNLPLFALAVFLPFTEHLTSVGKNALPFFPKSWITPLRYGIPLLLLIGSGLLFFQTLTTESFGMRVEPGATKAVDFYLKKNLSGPIFNNFDIGSYLEYRLYPKEKVFIDGRPEAYPASFIQDLYIPMQQSPDMFKQATDHYTFQTILFSHTDQTPWAETFLSWITKDPSWKAVYLDDTMIILIPRTSPLPEVSDQTLHLNPSSLPLQSLLQLAHFYSVAGWTDHLLLTLTAILQHEPRHCPALQNLAILLQQKNDPSFQVYAQQYHQYCSSLLQ